MCIVLWGQLQLLVTSQGVCLTSYVTRKPLLLHLLMFVLLLLYLQSNYCKPNLISYLINKYFTLLLLIYLVLQDEVDFGSN